MRKLLDSTEAPILRTCALLFEHEGPCRTRSGWRAQAVVRFRDAQVTGELATPAERGDRWRCRA